LTAAKTLIDEKFGAVTLEQGGITATSASQMGYGEWHVYAVTG